MPASKKRPDFGPLFTRLSSLLEQLDKDPVPKKRKGPGRPTKHQAATTPIIVHLYTSQVRWLDDYADLIAAIRPEKARLSGAEVIRGLWLGLGRFALDADMPLPDEKPIQTERDLQHA